MGTSGIWKSVALLTDDSLTTKALMSSTC